MARSLWTAGLLAGASLVCLGCNSVAGIHDPVDKEPGSSGALPDDGGSGDNLDRFVGRWTTPGSVQTLSGCSLAGTLQPQILTLVLSRGATGDTIIVSPEAAPLCRLSATVQGDEALLLPAQTCAFSFATGETDTYTYTAPSTFTISGMNSALANVHVNAKVFRRPPGEQCLFEENSVYKKQP